MAGLFGLFGGNKEEDPTPKDAFFLDDESAKSMGDTSYMKEVRTIRRTYPRGGGAEEFEVIKTVSAIKSTVNDSRKDFMPKRVETTVTTYTPATSFSSSSYSSAATPSYSAPEPTPTPEVIAPVTNTSAAVNEVAQKRRQSDNSMDMFRNMAKKIGK